MNVVWDSPSEDIRTEGTPDDIPCTKLGQTGTIKTRCTHRNIRTSIPIPRMPDKLTTVNTAAREKGGWVKGES